jgi:hypothetical protein
MEQQMQPKQENPPPRNFGKPIELDLLLGYAEIDAEDIVDALEWWDENASEEWVDALDNEPIGKKKR